MPFAAARPFTRTLLVAALLAAAACSAPAAAPAVTPGSSTTVPPATTGAPGSAAPTTGAAPSQAATVTIASFAFVPLDITVAPGTTVTVVNQDTANHTVTATDHSFDTGNIPGHATGTLTAPTKPGNYPYICAIHPFMTGTLTVS